MPMPVGSEMSTSVRTPGEASAPSSPVVPPSLGLDVRVGGERGEDRGAGDDRDGGDDQRARGRGRRAAITAVSSGPLMKISSIIVESSA